MNDLWLCKTNESGDWNRLYRNRKLVMEGHSFNLHDLFEAIGEPYESIEITDEEMEQICGTDE